MSRGAWIGAALLASLVIPPAADATDTSPPVVIGGLASQPVGSVRSLATEVSLDGDAVQITLHVAVRADSPARLSLTTPLFEWLGDAVMYPDRKFPELAVSVDGAPADVRSQAEASMGRRDVTDLVTRAGLDPLAVSLDPPFVSPAGERAAFDKLVTLHAVTRLDQDYLVKWSARRTVSWPAGSTGDHTVVLRYTARPGFGLTTLALLGRTLPLSIVCLTQSTLAAKLWASGATEFVARAYTLPAGVDGRTGALTTNVKASFAAFCGARGEASTGPNPSGPAMPDAKGAVHILTLSPPGS